MHHLRGDHSRALDCALRSGAPAAFAYIDAALAEFSSTPLGAPDRLPAFKAALMSAIGRLVEVGGCLFWRLVHITLHFSGSIADRGFYVSMLVTGAAAEVEHPGMIEEGKWEEIS